MEGRILTHACLMTWLLSSLAIAAAHADAGDDSEATAWSHGAECDGASRYEWRGLALSQGPVAQPSLWLSRSGFTLTLWGSAAFGDRDPAGFHELDPSLEYEREIAGWTLTPTIEFYQYLGTHEDPSAEVELQVAHVLRGSISAFARQSVDIRAYSGATSGGCGLKRETDSKSAWSWSASAHLDWDSGQLVSAYLGQPATTLQIAAGSAALTRHFAHLYVRAHAEVDAFLDRDLRARLAPASPLSGGAALGAEW